MNLLAKLKHEFINVDQDEAIDDREPFGTTKGQLISKCLWKNRLDQNTTEKFDRFCPEVLL